MTMVSGFLAVSWIYRPINPIFHASWFEDISSLNGEKVTDYYISDNVVPTLIPNESIPVTNTDWNSITTSRGLDRYYGIAVSYESFDEARRVASLVGPWELARGVLLYLHVMRQKPIIGKIGIELLSSSSRPCVTGK